MMSTGAKYLRMIEKSSKPMGMNALPFSFFFLDGAVREAKRLLSEVGVGDRARIDEYLDGARGLKGGRLEAWAKGTPLCNVHLGIARAAGAQLESFGDSTGVVAV